MPNASNATTSSASSSSGTPSPSRRKPPPANPQHWRFSEEKTLRCGELYIVGFPSEIFLETGLAAQRAVAQASGADPTRVLALGYCNGGIGYLPTASAIPEGGYEVGAWRHSERPGGFTADAERRLVDCAARLAAGLARPA